MRTKYFNIAYKNTEDTFCNPQHTLATKISNIYKMKASASYIHLIGT